MSDCNIIAIIILVNQLRDDVRSNIFASQLVGFVLFSSLSLKLISVSLSLNNARFSGRLFRCRQSNHIDTRLSCRLRKKTYVNQNTSDNYLMYCMYNYAV